MRKKLFFDQKKISLVPEKKIENNGIVKEKIEVVQNTEIIVQNLAQRSETSIPLSKRSYRRHQQSKVDVENSLSITARD